MTPNFGYLSKHKKPLTKFCATCIGGLFFLFSASLSAARKFPVIFRLKSRNSKPEFYVQKRIAGTAGRVGFLREEADGAKFK